MSSLSRRVEVTVVSESVTEENYLPEPRRGCLAHLMGAGRIRRKTVTIQRRRMSHHVLMLVQRGSGWFSSASCPRRVVSPGQVLLLFPGEEHTYGPDQSGWDELWISACGSLFRSLESEQLITRSQPVLDTGLDPHLVEALARLVDDVLTNTGTPAWWAARAHVVWVQAAMLARQRETPHSTVAVVAQAQALLGADLARVISNQQLADACGMSYDRLRKVFTATIGMPPMRWRLERRIAEAKRLLADQRQSIADIIERLGFANRAHFGHRFREVAGMSPSAWRQMVLGAEIAGEVSEDG